MENLNKKDFRLKWHRFLQFAGMPLCIAVLGYRLISMISDLFGLGFTWTDGYLKALLDMAGTDAFHLGSYFWPVVGMLAAVIVQLVLVIYAWIGSFRWQSYSRRCWIAFLLIQTAYAGIYIWAVWEYMLNRGGLIAMAPQISMYMKRPITITTTLITAIRVCLIVTALLQLWYLIANIIYYAKRKGLYRSSEDIQEPYTAPAAAQNTAPKPQPVTHAKQNEADIFTEKTEPDSLDIMLKETEEALNAIPVSGGLQLNGENEKPSGKPEEIVLVNEAEPVSKPQEEIVLVNEPENVSRPQDGEITLTLEPEETPESEPVQLTLPEKPDDSFSEPAPERLLNSFEEEADEEVILPLKEEIAEEDRTEIIPLSRPEDTQLRFCPECGASIPDPEMRFCIRCGRKIR